jgi:hypothetical protein
MAWSSISEELTGRGGESGYDRSDASGRGGCLLDPNRTPGVTRSVSSAARPVTLLRERVLLSDRYDRTNDRTLCASGQTGPTRPVTPSVVVL